MPAEIATLLRRHFLPAYVQLRGDASTSLLPGEGWTLLHCNEAALLQGRSHELFVHGAGAAEVLAVLNGLPSDARPWVTTFDLPAPDRAALEAAGLVCSVREFLMTAELDAGRSEQLADPNLHHLTKTSDAQALNAQLDHLFCPPEKLEKTGLNFVWADIDGEAAAYGRSSRLPGGGVVMDDIGTRPDFRRRGLGQRIMRRLMADAARQGEALSVLISSEMGRPLYSGLGYRKRSRVEVLIRAPETGTV